MKLILFLLDKLRLWLKANKTALLTGVGLVALILSAGLLIQALSIFQYILNK